MQEESKSQPHKRSWVKFLSIWLFSLLLIAILLFALLLIVILPFFDFEGSGLEANNANPLILFEKELPENLPTFQENTLLPISEIISPEDPPVQKIKVIVTGYSSTPWQTDDTPFVTAAGTLVREGIVATNLLPIGTKIKIPEIYGEKIFVVEDRMSPRNYYHIDIWFPSYWEALNFGAKRTYIEILEG